ncbi:FeoB-associated Cys-rich membrane protein [Clostridium sp.]
MGIEVLITIGIVAFAASVIFAKFRKKSTGGCGCGHGNEPKRKFKSKF